MERSKVESGNAIEGSTFQPMLIGDFEIIRNPTEYLIEHSENRYIMLKI
jgi:hypothetical protein